MQDNISSLDLRNSALHKELTRQFNTSLEERREAAEFLASERARLVAENAKLREALEGVLALFGPQPDGNGYAEKQHKALCEARAALYGK